MHRNHAWLPEGDLDKRLEPNVAKELLKLARSIHQIRLYRRPDRDRHDSGKQNIRIALEGIALEREMVRAAEFKYLDREAPRADCLPVVSCCRVPGTGNVRKMTAAPASQSVKKINLTIMPAHGHRFGHCDSFSDYSG